MGLLENQSDEQFKLIKQEKIIYGPGFKEVEEAKVEVVKVEEPKVEEPKVEEPKVEEPKVVVKVEEAKVEDKPNFNDMLLLFQKCVNNNISINLTFEVNNSEFTLIYKKLASI